MSAQKILILGAGAAGTAAARVLGNSDAVTVTLIGRTDETPYNRTLVNKGIAIGLLTPEQAVLPGLDAINDTAIEVDADARIVRLESGRTEHYDALLIATGSAPRDLDADLAVAEATVTGRITALHSLHDAVTVRDLLASLGRPARVVISGAGLVAGETATLLRDRGHDVTLLARAATPGISVFGPELAEKLAAAHQANLHTAFGRTITSLTETEDGVQLTLDDGTVLPADVLIVAHGTTPTAPAPWGSGVAVDGDLRTATPHVYAAGGVAIHEDPALGTWRIDHWSDAAAQGEHAARTLLVDLGVGDQPGPYQPRAPFTATIHGAMIAGAGLTGHHGAARPQSADPLVILHEQGSVPVGVLGLDAVPAVFGWMPHLYTPADTDGDTLAVTAARTADSK